MITLHWEYIPIGISLILALWFWIVDKDNDIILLISVLFSYSLLFSAIACVSLLIKWVVPYIKII